MATALITGAAKRIGRAIASDLAANGHDVIIHHHGSPDEAHALKGDLSEHGVAVATIAADLSNRDDTEALIEKASALIGKPITLLINNASIYEKDNLKSATRDTWDRHMEINLHAPFTLTQKFAAALPDGVAGLVINIIDQRVWKLNPQFMSYTLSKASLWTLTQTSAQALAPQIRVNAIGPGPTLPSIHQKGDGFTREEKDVPLGHGPSLDEITGAIKFIHATPSMTGQMIALDGGQHLAWKTPDINSDDT